MTKFVTWVVLFIITVGGSMAQAVTISASSPFDTRCFSAFLKQAIPDFNFDTGAAVSYSLRQYGAAGDDNVTQSPVCGDVNPAIAISVGSLPTGLSLTTTNLNNATISGTPSSTGAVSFTVSYDNSVGAAVTDAVAGTITAAGGTGVPIANGTATGVSRFVDCNAGAGGGGNGSDLLDGQTPLTSWGSISKANSLFIASGGVTAGTDLWIKAGSTCKQQLKIALSGTSSDHVRVGTYYCSDSNACGVGSVAYENTPTNPTAWPTAYTYTYPRPILQGTCATLQWTDTNCKFSSADSRWSASNQSGAIPGAQFQGMVETYGDYIDVQDLKVYGSAGVGVYVTAGTTAYHDVMVKRVWIERAFHHAFRAYLAQRVTFRDSVVRHSAVDDFPDPGGSNTAAITVQNTHSSQRNDYLIEGNDFGQLSTGVQFIFRVNGLIVRGNRVYDIISSRPCLYGDDGDDIVVEYNICYGGGYYLNGMTPTVDTVNSGSRGIVFVYEIGGNFSQIATLALPKKHVPLTNVTIRGNMMTNTGGCIEFGDASQGVLTPPGVRSQEARIYNNSCLYTSGTPLNMNLVYTVGSGGFDIRDNIFQTSGTQPCLMYTPSSTAAAPTIDYNMWNVTATSACRNTHDVTGTATVAGATMDTRNGLAGTVTTAADFALSGGSAGLAAGIPLTTTILDTADFPQYTGVTVPCATFDVKGGLIDAICATRNATTPDLGSQERP